MTPCRNCTNGYNTAYIPRTDGSLEWEEPIRMTCQCCGGEYEDCKNCEREFPNSVEEIQEEDAYKAMEAEAYSHMEQEAKFKKWLEEENEPKKGYSWD